MTVLIDTSFLVALMFPRDKHHQKAAAAVSKIDGEGVIPAVVVPELFFMISVRMNYAAAVKSLAVLETLQLTLADLTAVDRQRMDAIMTQYLASRFDYVDVAIMALAERLRIADIYTFDQRDFSQFRPAHRPYLRLLP
jgi:predicted nucleic acid-binding protein